MEITSSKHHLDIDLAVVEELEYNEQYTEIENYIRQRSKIKEIISFDEIVQYIDIEHTVVITGNAQIGKSELTKKIVSKWVKGEIFNWKNQDRKIKLLFFIECHKLNTIDFLDTNETILRTMFPEVFQRVTIKQLIEFSDKVMFIVDGLDELISINKLDSLSEVRDKRLERMIGFVRYILCPRSRIGYNVVVGRPLIMQFIKNLVRYRESAQKVVYVCGFSSDSVSQYIKTNCDEKLQKKVNTELQLSEFLSTMSRVPVFLRVICSIYKDDMNIATPRTVTELMIYACLVLIRNHLIESEKSNVLSLRELCNRKDIMKLIESISLMSFISLYEKRNFCDEYLYGVTHDIDELEKKTGFIVKPNSQEFGNLYHFPHMFLRELFCGFHMFFAPKEKIDFTNASPISLVVDGKENEATHLNNCFAVAACVERIHQQTSNSLLSHFVKQLAEIYQLNSLTTKNVMKTMNIWAVKSANFSSLKDIMLYMRFVYESECEIPSTVKDKLTHIANKSELMIDHILDLRLKCHFFKKIEERNISFNGIRVLFPIESLHKEDIKSLAHFLIRCVDHKYSAEYKPIYQALLPDLKMKRIKMKAVSLYDELSITIESPLFIIMPFVDRLNIFSTDTNVMNIISKHYVQSNFQFKHLTVHASEDQFKHLTVHASEDADHVYGVCDMLEHLTTLELYIPIESLYRILYKMKENLKNGTTSSLNKFTCKFPLYSNFIIKDNDVLVELAKYIPCVNLTIENHYDEYILQWLQNIETALDNLVRLNVRKQHTGRLEIIISTPYFYDSLLQKLANSVQIISNKLRNVLQGDGSIINFKICLVKTL